MNIILISDLQGYCSGDNLKSASSGPAGGTSSAVSLSTVRGRHVGSFAVNGSRACAISPFGEVGKAPSWLIVRTR